MTEIAAYVIGPILCYLLGSIPVAYLLVKGIKRIDIRTIGSGNVGATNASRAFDPRYKIWVFVAVFGLDILKGVASIALIFSLLHSHDHPNIMAALRVLYGLLAVLGHIWPIYLSFRGGKGVATSAGVLLYVAPYAMLVAAAAFLITFVLTKYISLGSIAAALFLTLGHFARILLENRDPFGSVFFATTCFCVIISTIVVYRHRSNIKRLVEGTESRFGEDG